MALHAELGVLLPVKNHLDGLADLVLRHQQSAAEHVGEMLLAAERAAGGALANDDIVIGNVQQSGNGLADVERALGGGIETNLPSSMSAMALLVSDGRAPDRAFRWSPQKFRPPRQRPPPSACPFSQNSSHMTLLPFSGNMGPPTLLMPSSMVTAGVCSS